jgi:predicted amidophosphoribosyltransferase
VDSLVRAVSLKFEEMGPLADWFVELLAEVVLHQATKLQADLVVSVPLHKDRRRERGFTQAELLPGETAGNFLTRACFW